MGGRIRGLKITNSMSLSHLPFIGYILLFCNGSINEQVHFQIIDIYCSATGYGSEHGKIFYDP